MLSVIFGVVGIILGIAWLFVWGAWEQFILVIKGSVPPFLILVGLVAVAAGISSIKDNAAAKKEESRTPEEESGGASSGGSSGGSQAKT